MAAPDGVDGLSPAPSSSSALTTFVRWCSGRRREQAWRVPIRMVRTARWKYVRYLNYGEELNDLVADPGELRNLAREPSGKSERARLARELDDWIRLTAIRSPR